MKYYKNVICKQLFEEKYSISLKDFDLYKQDKRISDIPTICDNCGDIFWLHKTTFKKRLCYTEYYEKCFGDTWFCNKQECKSKKKSLVCIDRMLMSKESQEKRLEAAKNRKGKSYEEQYGEEKAKQIKNVIKEKRAKQPEPMKGKHHSDKAKLKMSLSKQQLISAKELKWTHPVTKEPCTYIEEISAKASLWHKNPENRKAFAEFCLHRQLKSARANRSFKQRWFDNKQIPCQSSYEERYIDLLNENKIYYDRCDFMLPYKYKDKVKHYNPDFTIFSDKDCTKITHIVEVKPKIFINSDYQYAKKNLVKLSALEAFCRYNNYIKVVITEEQLNENKIY